MWLLVSLIEEIIYTNGFCYNVSCYKMNVIFLEIMLA